MKGMQHDVLEIRDTQNEEIERILVFLKPGEHTIDLNGTRRQAQDILGKVKVKRKKRKFFSKKQLLFFAVCGFVALVLFALGYMQLF